MYRKLEDSHIQPNGHQKILILGGGYGGLRAAMRLGDAALKRAEAGALPSDICLVDQFDYHQLITELHEVAAASIPPRAVALPLSRFLKDRPVRFVQTRVTGFDFEGQKVVTEAGELGYDILVIGLGSETDFFGIEGLQEHSLVLKSLSDALLIKERLYEAFMKARSVADPEARRALLTFVIGGGGFTGTELAGELADRASDLAKEQGPSQVGAKIVVVEAGPTLLAGFDPDLIRTARKILESKGVELHLGSAAVRVTGDVIELKSGEKLSYGTLIWTGGVKALDLVARSGLKTGVRGRVVVNPFMEAVDFANVYVIGDLALVLHPETGRPLAPSAQLALQQANCAAKNILAQLSQRERVPCHLKIVGEVVSVGRNYGLAKIGRLGFDGRPAHMLKRMTIIRYLYMLGGVPLVWEWLRLMAEPRQSPIEHRT